MALVMNRAAHRNLACLAASLFLLPGCTTTDDYPSLARRPAEGSISPDPAICPAGDAILALGANEPGGEPGRVGGTAQPAPALNLPPPPTTPSRDLTTRLAQLVSDARAAHGRFGARRAEAERAISAASGAAQGSESWSVASVALSGLESARSEALVALGELDQRYADLTVSTDATMLDLDAVTVARDEVNTIVAEEDAVLARLRGRLR